MIELAAHMSEEEQIIQDFMDSFSIDEMPAGRETDALLTVEIGWEVQRMPYAYANLPNDWRYRMKPGDCWIELPHFSTDMAATWKIIKKLEARHIGRLSLVRLGWHPVRIWRAAIFTTSLSLGHHAWGDTAPLAICRAALMSLRPSSAPLSGPPPLPSPRPITGAEADTL